MQRAVTLNLAQFTTETQSVKKENEDHLPRKETRSLVFAKLPVKLVFSFFSLYH